MIGSRNDDIAQPVRINAMTSRRFRQPWFWIDRFDAHQPHESLNPFAIDRPALLFQRNHHASASVKRRARVLLIQEPHQLQILRRLALRCVIPRRARQSDQLALLRDAQCLLIRVDAFAFLAQRRKIPDFF